MPKSPEQNAVIREQSRQRILEKALELFAKRGFHATSISQIAKAAGVAKGALYHYFDSKQDLFTAIVKESIKEIGDIYSIKKDDSPREHFQTMFDRLITSMDERRDFWKLYASLMTQGNLMNDMMDVLKPFIEVTMGGFVNILNDFGLQKTEAEMRAFGAFIDGICLHYLFVYENNYPIREVFDVFLDSFLGKKSDDSSR